MQLSRTESAVGTARSLPDLFGKERLALLGLLVALCLATVPSAWADEADGCPAPAVRIEAEEFTPVTSQNYATAETQSLFAGAYIALIAKSTCTPGMGVLMHEREPSDPSHRAFARVNYDTLYSWLLLDLTTPATISMPETDGRYQSAQVLNEGHWMPFVITEPGSFTLTRENSGSRYVLVGFRTQMNMQDRDDIAAANALQDLISVEQAEPGEMVFTDRWNKEEILALRKELQILRDEKGYKSEDMFGKEGEIDFDMNNVGVAIGWGGQPKEGAVYLFYTPDSDEHQTLTMSNVPHADNAFWSITVYDEDGFVASEPFNMNSSFAKTNVDGDTVLNFGGDPSADNYLPVYPGWNATLRIYTPQPNYFDGSWVRPELQPAD
jgi:hypothetical protein